MHGMKLSLIAIVIVSAAFAARDRLEAFGHTWIVPCASDWKVETIKGTPALELLHARGPLPGPRRPIQFALADTPELKHVTLDLDARPLEKSLIIIFAYRDPEHFDYAHLSTDAAAADPHHNGIFHVYGGERVRISTEEGPAAFSATQHWYHVRLTTNAQSGTVQVTVDGRSIPALHAIDLSLRGGKIGLGSYDETAEFKNVKFELRSIGQVR
jgi:hypothetical protein